MDQLPPGVHRAIVCVDVEAFGDRDRTNLHQVAVRKGLYRSLCRAFTESGIPWDDCYHEDRGDGAFILVAPHVPKNRLITALPRELAAALIEHNRSHDPRARIRLRVALHAGEVHYDDHGVTGAALNFAFRLLEAPALKSALSRSPGVLALITSDWFFEEVVRHDPAGAPAGYRPARVTVKETTATAWIRLPDQPCPPPDAEPTAPRTAAYAVSPAAVLPGALRAVLGRAGWRRRPRAGKPPVVPARVAIGDASSPAVLEQLAAAVRVQWSDEAQLRGLHLPQPLRLRWSTTGRPVSAHPAAVLGDGAVGGRPVQLRLHGSLDDIVTAFTSLPRRQLVVLGEPGAGKTALAILLTLGLIDHRRAHGGPVPVLLSLSSWNPRAEHLHTWVARRLAEDYPALANAGVCGPSDVVRMVTDGHILPILDGLDEMLTGLHTETIAAIDRACAGGPLVVTCRSAEYEAAVAAGTVVSTAAVVELKPVGVREMIAFLSTGGVAGDTRWHPVFAHLRRRPAGTLAQALSSPLMVALARIAYTDPRSRPGELLDTGRFGDRPAIENHLLDAFIPATYTPRPPPPAAGQPRRTGPPYEPGPAREWLTFLARHLERHRTHDLAWWQLHQALSPAARPLTGVALGLGSGLAGGLMAGVSVGLEACLAAGLAAGLVIGLVTAPPAYPKQLNARIRGRLRLFARRLVLGLAVGFLTGLAAGLTAEIVTDGPRLGLTAGIVVGIGLGLTFGVMEWLDAPADTIRSVNPATLLRDDRAVSVIRACVETCGASLGGGHAARLVLGHPLGLTTGLSVGVAVGLTAGLTGRAAGRLQTGFGASAWAWYLVSRSWLALRGDLPWRLAAFLEDAHRRGVLRRTGPVYQFRHARLQDHLAAPAVTYVHRHSEAGSHGPADLAAV